MDIEEREHFLSLLLLLRRNLFMKPIQLRKTTIDIPFLDDKGNEQLVLHFDRSDENIKRLYRSFDEIKKQAEVFEKENTDDDFEEAAKFVKTTMDAVLGDGAFEQVYALSPSIFIVTTYFYQLAVGIKEELEQEDLQAAESKYLK